MVVRSKLSTNVSICMVTLIILILIFVKQSSNPNSIIIHDPVPVKNYRPVKVFNISPLVHIYDVVAGSRDEKTIPFNCVKLSPEVVEPTPICIYDPKIDIYVSKTLLRSGKWEDELVKVVINQLKHYDDMAFLDLGCNLGVYTIVVAKYGRPVVAVDANVNNLRLVSRSLVLGNLENTNVNLLWNAISDEVGKVSLKFGDKNVGGTRVVVNDTDTGEEDTNIQAVTLDNLVDPFAQRQLFIKMDIETAEWKALKGGTKFFESVDVLYVLMEWWSYNVNRAQRDVVTNFFTSRSYNAYNPRNSRILDVKKSNNWPQDVIWVKNGAKFNNV